MSVVMVWVQRRPFT